MATMATEPIMRAAFAPLLVLASLTALVEAQDEVPGFVERPGIVEFSGQMIVRPLQHAALAELGVTAADRDVIRARAAARLRPHLIEYVPATDEYIVTLPSGQSESDFARGLMATGDYQYAEPDWLCHPTETIPDDPSYSMQWHHPHVRSPLAWDTTTGDPSLVIAIVDGGVQLDHPDLAGALVPGYNSDDDLAQIHGGDVGDVDGHGTFVAGLAGAIGNNGTHVTGMGWNFSIMPIRYYNQPGGGYLHNILEGARWAAENGARCINVSQTGVEYSSVQTTGAYVKSLGALMVWAAGNDGRDLSWFDWDDVIIVGSTDPSDGKAPFSAYGLAVDVFAPGTDIVSTGIPSVLAIGSGTSASAPMAAGICALVWSRHPHLAADQVEECLFGGGVDLGLPGNDDYWGWGRVDSPRSLETASIHTYCASSPNSVGGGALIGWSGSASVSANDLLLFAGGCPPGKPAIFFYGPQQTQVPFGNGQLCVAGGAFRLSVVQVDPMGIAMHSLDVNDPPNPHGQISSGDTWNFQCWYRDPGGGGSGFNLSDALETTFSD